MCLKGSFSGKGVTTYIYKRLLDGCDGKLGKGRIF